MLGEGPPTPPYRRTLGRIEGFDPRGSGWFPARRFRRARGAGILILACRTISRRSYRRILCGHADSHGLRRFHIRGYCLDWPPSRLGIQHVGTEIDSIWPYQSARFSVHAYLREITDAL